MSTALIEVLLVAGAVVLFLALKRLSLSKNTRVASISLAVNNGKKERRFGEWEPVAFNYPEFEAWSDFDLHKTEPIPYRPFRWGPNYTVTMGIRPMSWESWIDLDNTYLQTLEIRKARARARGDKAVRTLPGAERAALEVCTELASYLSKRYPHMFRVTRVHDGGGLGQGDSIVGKDGGRVKIVEILPTGDRWDLDVDDPMLVGGLLAEDLAVMVEGADGQYYFRAGAICVPGFWRLSDKIGLPLKEIHLRGGVYKYKENLQLSLDRFFRKLPVDKPVLRNNYFFQIDDDLAWSNVHHGDEDTFDQSTHSPLSESRANSDWQPPQPKTDMSEVFFRSERQSLRRMPITGCICFTIRTYFHPVTELVQEPGIPGKLAAAIRSWPDPIAESKGKALYANTMLPWLDELHQKQIEAGVISADDKPNNYPF